ncbi:Aerotaxis receptor [Roseovarius sp. THAF8]|uniref:PAS domain-containing protein n=1 Tax=Roseovarius sp. THAF8 TaxID=2587846 RepID=UPI001267F489|nr:PAS domain-containing protein [Roseovarius sp. THAF8]QFT98969.1 Aerotaxis receptor [Roseovarius sp. THAF8]
MQQTTRTSDRATMPGGEVDFPREQLLASATDTRGVIRYANSEFCRVAGMSKEELVGAPHKVVRHPDMPRGLFHLMWQRLQARLPVCAYVKNASADGRYYWVFASITPTRDGYLSVRIKPGADFFEFTRDIYTDALAEEARGLPPDKSAEYLVKRLSEKNFPDFESYAFAALNAEFSLREDIDETADADLRKISKLTDMMTEAEALVHKIISIFQQVRGEPINLRILSSRLEGAGVAIGTISKNYETMSDDMYQMVDRLRCDDTGLLVRMRAALAHAHSASQMSALMDLTAKQSALKHNSSNRGHGGREILHAQAESLSEISRAAVSDVATLGKIIPDVCRQLRRRINGLDLVKLLCRVESGRMSDIDSGLLGIIHRLEHAHHQTDRHLAALSATAIQIDSTSTAL